MSKSLGNFAPCARCWLIGRARSCALALQAAPHYRQPIDWTLRGLEEASRTLDRCTTPSATQSPVRRPTACSSRCSTTSTPRRPSARCNRLDDPAALKAGAGLLGLLGQTKSRARPGGGGGLRCRRGGGGAADRRAQGRPAPARTGPIRPDPRRAHGAGGDGEGQQGCTTHLDGGLVEPWAEGRRTAPRAALTPLTNDGQTMACATITSVPLKVAGGRAVQPVAECQRLRDTATEMGVVPYP